VNRGFVFAVILPVLLWSRPGAAHAGDGARNDTLPVLPPTTFCNPLNLDYGWSTKGYRHAADPMVVLFKDRYYLFTTWDVPGYRVSETCARSTGVWCTIFVWMLLTTAV
jgi:hypothetical protein